MKFLKLILPVCIIFSGCENFTWFHSAGSIEKAISGTWLRQFLSKEEIDYKRELWKFEGDKVTVFSNDLSPYSAKCDTMPFKCDEGYADLNKKDANDTLLMDSGRFIIDANIDRAFLKTSGFSASGQSNYNHKWTIVEIKDDLLFIVADAVAGNVQREFTKE